VDTGDESEGSDDDAEHSDEEDQHSQGEKVNFCVYFLSLIFEVFITPMINQPLTKYLEL
jgi:hypothetical protein